MSIGAREVQPDPLDIAEAVSLIVSGVTPAAIAQMSERLSAVLPYCQSRMDGLPRAWRVVEGQRVLVTLCPTAGDRHTTARSAQPSRNLTNASRRYTPPTGPKCGPSYIPCVL